MESSASSDWNSLQTHMAFPSNSHSPIFEPFDITADSQLYESSLFDYDPVLAETATGGTNMDLQQNQVVREQPVVIDLTGDGDEVDPESMIAGTNGVNHMHSRQRRRRQLGRSAVARPPRFHGDILIESIDLEDTTGSTDNTVEEMHAPASPEVEFVSSRQLSVQPSTNPQQQRRLRSVSDFPPNPMALFHHIQRRIEPGGRALFHIPSGQRTMRRSTPRSDAPFPYHQVHHHFVTTNRSQPPLNLRLDVHLVAAGFDYETDVISPNSVPGRPTYVPPPAVAEGFTRTPTGSDLLVCANCGNELCEGESDQKRQIWVLKPCGHVYCGDCNNSRGRRVRKQDRANADSLPPPLITCAADGCNGKVNKRTMIQVYL